MIRKAIAILLLIAAIIWSFKALLPGQVSDLDTEKNKFSTARALVHLEAISQKPHSGNNKAHAHVRTYIIEELEKLGLEPIVQQDHSIRDWGNLVSPKNILARIKGSESENALLLLSHYDSAPHSSFGASDAGSGVVTILEGVRAFLSDGKIPKNDIIILFSDAEELGLNGADIFVNKHEWAKDVRLVLNFESRGSGGPSNVLVETNDGNSKLIQGFVEANPKYPVANSLAYSIYKMLPNDTDLTRFREDADIDGFNFAFIDDHYDYHTALDNFERLDRNTLEHQGSYLMPMLNYFSETDLSNLKSEDDSVYFNVPLFRTVSYPFALIWPMLILAFIIFGMLLIYGLRRRRIDTKNMLRGFIPFLGAVILSGLVAVLLWRIVLKKVIYPEYSEMLHGFTYNGHTYIAAFVFVSLGICFWIYGKYYKPGNSASMLVAPITVWLVICLAVAIKLKGASFFIVPVFFALVSFLVLLRQRKPNLILMALLCFPLLMIMSPFVQMFPVGLGLDILFVSAILVALIFGLLQSVFEFIRHKKRWSYAMYFIAFCLLIAAHFNSGFNADNPKPNSLVYMLDGDTNSALWATYDNTLDDWTKAHLGEDPTDASDISGTVLDSKYSSGFTYVRDAEVKALEYPDIEVFKDSVIGDLRYVSIYVESNRNADRIEFFAATQLLFRDFTLNGVEAPRKDEDGYAFQDRRSNRLFTYFVSDEEPLELHFTVPIDQQTRFVLYEASNDLLTNRLFDVKKRDEAMIPKPFILNDATIIKKTIIIE